VGAGLTVGLAIWQAGWLGVALGSALVIGLVGLLVRGVAGRLGVGLGVAMGAGLLVRLVSGLVSRLAGWLGVGLVGWLGAELAGGLGATLAGGPSQLASALVIGLVGLLIAGLTTFSVQKRTDVNGGLKQSAVQAAVMALPCLALAAALAGLMPTALAPQLLAIYSLTLAFYKGGAFCIKHLAMRYLLVRLKCIPARYEALLYFSVERVLMIRQGGSFRFIHRMLQEHLAAHPFSTPR
jgi:hypothetical protein